MIRRIALWIAAPLYLAAGAMHFLFPAPYLKIMPPRIPWHAAMVAISGAAEMAGGLGLTIPRFRAAAGWGLAALLIAVFPANIYMAMDHVQIGPGPISPVLLWARLGLYPLLIWWVLWFSHAFGMMKTE